MISPHERGSTLISVRRGWQDVTNQRGGERGRRKDFLLFLRMFWCFCLKHVWNSLAIASSCQDRNVKIWCRRRGKSHDGNHSQVEKKTLFLGYGHGSVIGDFSFFVKKKTILNPLLWEHLEGIQIPVEGKLAPDGWTKPRPKGWESKVRSTGLMWKQKKNQWITFYHFVSFLLTV